jgi:hypothetical protein
MKPAVSIAIIICGNIGLGQTKPVDDVKMKQPKNVRTTSAPVTHAEAAATLEKAWKSLSVGLKAKGQNPVNLPSDSTPITKNEVLKAFKSIVVQVEPMFKRSSTKVRLSPTRIRKDFDIALYKGLVENGFVMPVSPIMTGKNGTLSTYEFGDAVGVLLIRIADLTHLPSRKFTPALMPNG